MERSEPTLVPEWLKSAGSSSGSGPISHTDDHVSARFARNKSFVNTDGHDFGRASSSERTTSSYFRRSSSSNSSGNVRSYSSFGRNQRDKDKYVHSDQDKSANGGHRYRVFSDALRHTPLSKPDRDGLSHSQLTVNRNGVVSQGIPLVGVNKAAFERDFPSLGADERAVTPEVRRVPSPALSTAIQSLPGTSTLVGGEKWTSALAEVPVFVGSNGTISSSVQKAAPSSSASGESRSTISLNMAEAVAQGPSRAQTTQQLSVGTQKLEELVMKQSRQLIPMTPSMPKTLALNSSDKQKSKVVQHAVSSSFAINNSPRGGLVKGDVPKTSSTLGKLHVLKPAREKNGVVIPVAKDKLSPTSGTKAVISSPPPNNAVSERKSVLTVLEKRPTSQARSRKDFFNLMRKKSLENPSSAAAAGSDINPNSSSHELEVSPADTFRAVESPLSANCGKSENIDAVSNGKKHPSCDPVISEEEEAAFLRSLGWEENDEEGCLTDEEINSFYLDLTKYINSNPSLKILKVLSPLDSQIKGSDGIRDAKVES